MEETYKVVTISERLDLEGMLRRHNEVYIIGGETMTDIEARATELLAELADGDFKVSSVNPITYARAILIAMPEKEDPDTNQYAVTVNYSVVEAGEVSKKKLKETYLVEASSLSIAEKTVEDYFTEDGGYKFTVEAAKLLNYAGVLNLATRTFERTKKGWINKSFVKEDADA